MKPEVCLTIEEVAEMVKLIEHLAKAKVSLKLPPPFPDNSVFDLEAYKKFCEQK